MNYSSLCHWRKKWNRPVRNCQREVPEESKRRVLGCDVTAKMLCSFLTPVCTAWHQCCVVCGGMFFSVPPHSILLVLLLLAFPPIPQDNRLCSKPTLFLGCCSSYQLKHTPSQTEDTKCIWSCMQTGRFSAASWFLLTFARTAASSHMLVLSSHFLNQLCSPSISNTQMKKKKRKSILSPVFSESENFETILGLGKSHTH